MSLVFSLIFRSHAIFTITIESMDTGPDGKQTVRVGHLHLVDLAGSERQVIHTVHFPAVFLCLKSFD